MNLITKRVHMNRCNGREVKQLTLDRDFNVPDARPDALQIMKEQGEVQIEEVHMMEGKASVKGLLHFQILYASDGDIPVSEMTGTIPFEETILLPQAKAEDEISVQAEIGDLKSELINSRKLGMKAIVVLNVTAGSVCDGEGAIDIEGGEDIVLGCLHWGTKHKDGRRKTSCRRAGKCFRYLSGRGRKSFH